jgi:hypothetical protein
MSVLVFAVVVVLWLAFGAALLLRQESLDVAWESFRTAPLPVQAAEGILLLPWILGLAVWEAGWALWVRLVLVFGLAWATVYAFLPWKGR